MRILVCRSNWGIVPRRFIKTMRSYDVRESFLKYFIARGHTHVPSTSIVPLDDPSLLFVTAGMNQFKSILLGRKNDHLVDEKGEPLRRAVNSQKCFRAGGKHNDLADVGQDATHHTFFEMLGNWSFGDYFKREACHFAWQYLTEVLELPADRIYVTYFGGDKRLGLQEDVECREIWRSIGVDRRRILPFDGEDNFWEMADTGPCGECSEIHFDTIGDRDASHLVNSNRDASVIEIWNLVFMQYNRDPSGIMRPLPCRHIDCGMGLERMTAVLQNVHSTYDTDIFAPLIDEISKRTNCGKYEGLIGQADKSGRDTAYRTLADHLRALCIAISDGVRPDATGRGYVLRRMLRRAARMSSVALHADRGLLATLVPAYISNMTRSFPEVSQNAELIKEVISAEESQFWKVVDRGEKMFNEEAERSTRKGIPFSGEMAWYLHNTHGFPIELTSLLADERKLSVDLNKFEELRTQAKMSREIKEDEKCWRQADLDQMNKQKSLPATDDSGKYDYTRIQNGKYLFNERSARIQAIFSETGDFVQRLKPNRRGCVILDETIFYAEQGGQIADCGALYDQNQKKVFTVDDVQKRNDYVLLIGNTTEQSLTVRSDVMQKIDIEHRMGLMRAHTGTHLLLHALRCAFGSSIHQKGSLVSPDRIRFDFSLQKALTNEQISELERTVNEMIEEALPLRTETLNSTVQLNTYRNLQSTITASLMEMGAYGQVRVVSVGKEGAAGEHSSAKAVECCCGTHLANTKDLCAFVIVSDKSLGSGLRRISAVTGADAERVVQKGNDLRERILKLNHSNDSFDRDSASIEKELKSSIVPLLYRGELYGSLKHLKKEAQSLRKKLRRRKAATIGNDNNNGNDDTRRNA